MLWVSFVDISHLSIYLSVYPVWDNRGNYSFCLVVRWVPSILTFYFLAGKMDRALLAILEFFSFSFSFPFTFFIFRLSVNCF